MPSRAGLWAAPAGRPGSPRRHVTCSSSAPPFGPLLGFCGCAFHCVRGPAAGDQLSVSAAPQVGMLKSFFEEQAMLLRAELRRMVALQLEELAALELRRTEAMQGLLERFGSLLERVETALESLSLAPGVV